MGIDAHIVVRNVPRVMVTTDWLKERSWKLCQAIGAKKFFISDGLPPDEYEKTNKAWHAAFDVHPLHAEYEKAYEKIRAFNSSADDRAAFDSIRAKIVADIGAFKSKELRLALEPVGSRYREDDDPPPGTFYRDDGSVEIVARPEECLLQVNLWGRYYGPGYERGDILTYCAIAEWLEQNIQGCEVWYGGDSSGVDIKLFDDSYRRELRRHLYSQEGRDYFDHGIRGRCAPKPCGLCPGGKYLGNQYGSSGDGMYAAFSCGGCGKNIETRDGGKTWVEPKED